MIVDRTLMKRIYSHRKAVVAHIKKRFNCDDETAETVFVEAALVIQRKKNAGGLEEVLDMEAFMAATCRNVWLKHYNKEKRIKEAVPNVERYFYDYLADRQYADDSINQLKEELFDATSKALKMLNEKCQALITYFYYEGKSMTDIARIMGFKSQAVATATKYRCFKELKDKAITIQRESY